MAKPKKATPMKIGKTRYERDDVRPHELKIKRIGRPKKRIFELLGVGPALAFGVVTFKMQEMKKDSGNDFHLSPVGNVIHGTMPVAALVNADPAKAQEILEKAMKSAARQLEVGEGIAANVLVGHQIIV